MNLTLVIIVVLLIVLFLMHSSKSRNNNDNYITAYAQLIIIITIPILIFIELMDWLLGNNIGTDLKNFILVTYVPLALFMLLLFVAWKRRIKNCIYVPLKYNEKYVLIIYNQKEVGLIKANYGIVRKRKLECEYNGMIRVINSRSKLGFSGKLAEVRYENGKKYNGYENKGIYVENYDFDGYKCDLIVFNEESRIFSKSVIFSFPTIEDIMIFINDQKGIC